jgi:hypothetical protein
MLKKSYLFAVGLFFCVAGAASDNELAERNETRNAAAEFFRAGHFSGLERMANEFRIDRSRTSGGAWKLADFYKGIAENALDFDNTQQLEWESAASGLATWIEAFPNSPTPYVAAGAALMARGWEYRGQSWAQGVQQSDMEAFHQYALQSAGVLLDNVEVASNDPHWYATLADVFQAIGAPKEDYLALTNEGLKRFPDYDPLYFESAGYHSAKWYGSDEELEAFARQSLEKTKAERGYEVYARIYWAAGMRSRVKYAFQSPNANWYYMEKGMDDIIAKYPSQWNINHFAYFSCYFWHQDAARKYMAMIQEPIVEGVWSPATNYQRCQNVIKRLDDFQKELDGTQ